MHVKGMSAVCITLDGTSVHAADIAEIALSDAPVSIGDTSLARALASFEAAEAIAQLRPAYGRNTGVGANRTEQVAPADAETHGLRLLRSHAGGIGPLLPAPHVRAMLAVRKSRCRKHHPPRLLQDHVREASPIPMPDLPEDILFKYRYSVLSTPTQARNL